MPSAPGAFTIIGGGGADNAPWATWKSAGGRSMAITTGPERSETDGETAATGVMAARTAGAFPGIVGAAPPGIVGPAPPTALANTSGTSRATPKAGDRVAWR